jgi:hypothetical protein
MENFFDLATPQELVSILGEDEPDLPERFRNYALDREEVLKNPDMNYAHLADLYAGRGDLKKADECLARIQDEELRFDCQLQIHEQVD